MLHSVLEKPVKPPQKLSLGGVAKHGVAPEKLIS